MIIHQDVTPENLERWLKGIEGLQAENLRHFAGETKEAQLPGRFFFHISYDAGELVMPKGTTNDYALLLLGGELQIIGREVQLSREGHQGCWENPLLRQLESSVDREAGPPSEGWLGGVVGLLARSFPGFTLWLMRSPWWRGWLVPLLRGRLGPVRRPERELANVTVESTTPQIGSVTADQAEPITPITGGHQFLGVTRAILNQPWGASLIAGEQGCEALLIRRVALIDLIADSRVPDRKPAALKGHGQAANKRLGEFCESPFFRRHSTNYLRDNLPPLLAQNRFFRDLLYDSEVNWPALIAALRSPPSGGVAGTVAAALRAHPRYRREANWLSGWLAQLEGALTKRVSLQVTLTHGTLALEAQRLPTWDRARVLVMLNAVLSDLGWGHSIGIQPADTSGELSTLLSENPTRLNSYQKARLNRLLLGAAFPGAFPTPAPIDFNTLKDSLLPDGGQSFGIVDRASGEEVYQGDETPENLYLVLSGLVELSRPGAGGQPVVLNNIKANGYFGATCATSPARSARALARTTLLRIDRATLGRLCQTFPWLEDRIQNEQWRDALRDEARERGERQAPTHIPLEMSRALLPARNALLIDMDRCTRCDQCVRGCAEAHEGQARFHRANPKMRFDNWEVAGACLHCVNPPCQLACPVGAIALLPGGEVQIHRTRCIGCAGCEQDCPYGVIDMVPLLSPSDGTPAAAKRERVANKCDLCLTDRYDPPCVACCPYNAAHRVDLTQAFPGLLGRANPV
jgi:Fe-S-cluster-containing dehydrogenase component